MKNYVQVVEFYYRLIRNSDTRLEVGGEESGDGSGDSEYSGDPGSCDRSEDYLLLEELE